MITVSPSLLSCDFLNLEQELSHFDSCSNIWFHLDIMDGHFVPNLTFGHPLVKGICNISKHPVDAHLMVTNPEFYVDTFKKYNIHNLTFHVEAVDKDELGKLVKKAKKDFKSIGVSIKPKTSLAVLSADILKEIDLILIMSVEPGFGGQSFIDSTWAKLEELKKITKAHPNIVVQVDGGVSNQNAKELINAGVTNLVAGSYIFNNDHKQYISAVESLRKKDK